MKLKNVLRDVWAKGTVNKKVEEVGNELNIDFSQDLTAGAIQSALLKLTEKARGKAKKSLEEIINRVMEGDIDPEWEKDNAAVVPVLSEEEQYESDKETILRLISEIEAEKENK